MFRKKTPCQPRLLFLGANHLFEGLVSIYKLQPQQGVLLADWERSNWGKTVAGFEVHDPETITPSAETKTVVLQPMINWLASDEVNYPQQLELLANLKIPRENAAFIHEPGRAHRFIAAAYAGRLQDLREIGRLSIFHDLFQRCNYAYGIVLAAEVGRRMGSPEVSIVETGVWFGAGLLNICEICDFLNQTWGIRFRIYGMDTGKGLPSPKDWRDHPELWASGSMVMPDHEALRRRLPSNAELILGDVAETVPELLDRKITADNPIGFISLDVDLYTASKDVLKLLDADVQQLAPAIPIWVDDSNINVFQGSYCGEALAIRQFNETHRERKIDHKVVRTTRPQTLWHHCFHFAHIFDSPYRNGTKPGLFADFFHTDF
jgi:hypothetical protein